MIRLLALCLLLPACVASGASIHNDRGGYLNDYQERRAEMVEQGISPRFSGYVHSAATMLIGVPGACAYPDTEFGFHGASVYGEHDPTGTMLMANTYPAALQSWFYTSGASSSYGADLITLSTSDLVDMGVIEYCEDTP